MLQQVRQEERINAARVQAKKEGISPSLLRHPCREALICEYASICNGKECVVMNSDK